ncbi:helix-turn-helix domain-containing protein [Brevibacillus laterosporus]|uniref:helix-turn-helix domain-containing protein n=1 Tax=Brevibacillus laterosporus TaxID=1465 RepID=UPI00215CF0B3|nr:helix-turn-helix domain-containing protein [Brevibacillus laterosporus]MCR8995215.1 helix-turn-helix domain-containing protein [Brevibacillus laterosporus]
MSVNLTFTTLGELIKRKREDLGISLSEVSRKTGISKGGISKIENGETKGPELSTLKPIADVLEIPYEEIIEYCIRAEYRYDVYDDLLEEAIEIANPSLINKVAIKFLENIKHETDSALEQLERFADSSTDNDTKITLYKTIVKYSRQHGIPHYIAKGLYQKYLIERQNLKRLEESFRDGEEITHYVDFLSGNEKITYYFKMALHAHNIKKYNECIEYCEAGLRLDVSSNELKARAYLSMINSYGFMKNYDMAEYYLDFLEKYEFEFVSDSCKITRAIIQGKRKHFSIAIPALRKCYEVVQSDLKIHVINELLDLYLQEDDFTSIEEIFNLEPEFLPQNPTTPYKKIAIGKYFQYKGNYLTKNCIFNEGARSYLLSLKTFGAVYAIQELAECMTEFLTLFTTNSKSMDLEYVVRLKQVYTDIANKKEGI